MIKHWLLASCLGLLAACGGGGGGGTEDESGQTGGSGTLPPVTGSGSWYQPVAGTPWQWQLQGTIDTSVDAEIYDIDLFDVDPAVIAALQSAGRRVICYFSAGSFEDGRPDATQFTSAERGLALDGFPSEQWLDIRSPNIAGIMQARLDLAVQKGCDGVEPDNVDGFDNPTGFPLSAADQLAFNRMLARESHSRGLSVGLKNDLAQIAELVAEFDFAVNEQCFEFDECDALAPFISAGKPVLGAEYRQDFVDDPTARDAMCAEARRRGFSTLVMPLDLDGSFRFSC